MIKEEYLYNFEDIENLKVDEFKNLLITNSGIAFSKMTLNNFIFFNDEVIDSGRGVYIIKKGAEIFYVGDCTSRSFIERIPSHFDTKKEAWMNTAVKHYARCKFGWDKHSSNNVALSNSAAEIISDYSLIIINFIKWDAIKISSLEKLLLNILNPINQPKRLNLPNMNTCISEAIYQYMK